MGTAKVRMENAERRMGGLRRSPCRVSHSTFELTVRLAGSGPVATSPEVSAFLLFVEPAEEFLESRIGLDFLDGVERVPQFVVGPGFVDEILARVAGWCRVPSAFATRHHVVPARGHRSFAKCATFGHAVDSIFLLKHNRSISIRQHSIRACELLAGLFHRLTPSAKGMD